MRKSPDSPVDDNLPAPGPPRVNTNAKKLAPVPKLDSSHFKPYLRLEGTPSVIDEFSPKKQFPTQDTIESSAGGSQTRRVAAEPPQKKPVSIDDLFDDDIVQRTQYVGLNGQANEAETQNEEHPLTVSSGGQRVLSPIFFAHQLQDTESTEQEPLRPRSPAGSEDTPVPVSLFSLLESKPKQFRIDAVVEQSEARERARSSEPEVRGN